MISTIPTVCVEYDKILWTGLQYILEYLVGLYILEYLVDCCFLLLCVL